MIVENCIDFKIRYVIRSLVHSKNVNVSTKFNDNLISYDAQRVYESISESVEKQMDKK